LDVLLQHRRQQRSGNERAAHDKSFHALLLESNGARTQANGARTRAIAATRGGVAGSNDLEDAQEKSGGARGRECVPGWKMGGSEEATGIFAVAMPTGSNASCARISAGSGLSLRLCHGQSPMQI
jgi:hypothetical protein